MNLSRTEGSMELAIPVVMKLNELSSVNAGSLLNRRSDSTGDFSTSITVNSFFSIAKGPDTVGFVKLLSTGLRCCAELCS